MVRSPGCCIKCRSSPSNAVDNRLSRSFIIAQVAAAVFAASSAGAATDPVDCAGLTSLAVTKTTIAAAESVAPGAFVPPAVGFQPFTPDWSKLPGFCRVTGSIRPTEQSDIRFELWLPTGAWNGKFMQVGNGAAAGSMAYFAMVEPLSRGYAVAHTDTGHRGEGGDFSWAAGEPEKLTDYRYRAVRELTVAGKSMTGAHYGKPPEKSYFVGCSTGGRQGLLEAQRYPGDYDGIIAGAPANHWSRLMALSIVIERNLGDGGLAVEKLGLLTQGALAGCDALDGVQDQVISRHGQCPFDPANLLCGAESAEACLDAGEVAAARRIYAGLTGRDGEVLYPGTGPGSEALWAFYASPFFKLGSSYFRHVVLADPAWDVSDFSPERDLERAEQADAGTMNATDPDLSGFIAGGGKLLMYHGTADGLIPYRGTVDYYERVVSALGREAAEDHVKLYLVPGMGHCSGGNGAWMVDWITALESWVEEGREPGALDGIHPAAESVPPGGRQGGSFSRPVCPYPRFAEFEGGDETDAASFECAAPRGQAAR